MLRSWILSFFLVFGLHCFPANLFSKECLCGSPMDDEDYSKVVKLLISSVERTPFTVTSFGITFPSDYDSVSEKQNGVSFFVREGSICWTLLMGGPYETVYRSSSSSLPRRIERKGVWSDSVDLEEWSECPDHKVYESFDLFKNYTSIPKIFVFLKQDCSLYYTRSIGFLQRRLQETEAGKKWERAHGGWNSWYYEAEEFAKEIKRLQKRFTETLSFIERAEIKAIALCKRSLKRCQKLHNNPQTYYELGLFDFLEGEYCDALDKIRFALSRMDAAALKKLQAHAALLKGQIESEVGLYAEAILSLTEAIVKDPTNKEAYFERAMAYFEQGAFNLALDDYRSSGVKSTPIESSATDQVLFAMGLSQGVLKGMSDGAIEFVPNMLASAYGLSHGLWTLTLHPLSTSQELVKSAYACIEFVRKSSAVEVLSALVPEFQELVQTWDSVAHQRRGELMGYVIGKYGIDIFLGSKALKSVAAYRDLKRANGVLTLESAASSEQNGARIAVEARRYNDTRKLILEKSSLMIELDKEGKHILGHKNYRPGNSVLTHKKIEELVKKSAGTGRKYTGVPGQPGYVEIVNFGEEIGYNVTQGTGMQTSTTWGKIHYAKGGVHVVPTYPRE